MAQTDAGLIPVILQPQPVQLTFDEWVIARDYVIEHLGTDRAFLFSNDVTGEKTTIAPILEENGPRLVYCEICETVTMHILRGRYLECREDKAIHKERKPK